MDGPKLENIKSKLKKCYKYKDLETAIYLSMYLSRYHQDFILLTGILLYENGEYSRALDCLSTMNGITALYFKALSYKKIKMYNESIHCLLTISEHKHGLEYIDDSYVKDFALNIDDTEFIDSLHGELMILKGNGKLGIEKYRKAVFKNPLLTSSLGLFDENILISPINEFKNDPIMTLFQDLFRLSIQNNSVEEEFRNDTNIFESLSSMINQHSFLNEYVDNVPGIGSYLLSKIASMYCKLTNTKTGTQIFEMLREKDSTFVKEMDIYSTTLWINKDRNLLGLLSKSLMSVLPSSHITWSVIGNYYSLCGLQKESTTCFMKSLSIQENPMAYSLLGFEYNIRNQYLEAQNYFKSSICMLENNDRAYFGLGVAYAETFKKQASEICFQKALLINPRSQSMKAYIVRFHVKNGENEKALSKIREYLGFNDITIDEIVHKVHMNMGKYTEMEELMLCELVEVLIKMKNKRLAEILLPCIQIRTSSYYSKRNLVENFN